MRPITGGEINIVSTDDGINATASSTTGEKSSMRGLRLSQFPLSEIKFVLEYLSFLQQIWYDMGAYQSKKE